MELFVTNVNDWKLLTIITKSSIFRCCRDTTSIVLSFKCGSQLQRTCPILLTLNVEKAGYFLFFFDFRKRGKTEHLFQKVVGIAGVYFTIINY